ncbi:MULTISPECIES: hypothetical protein [unclassified Pseudoalteromonas]|uniref:hypothetical protein n=1 Tax=unclassified Pseudoalteromonas TaxID=194690 RepID=UPI0003F6C849|nr:MULTISPECIES: hypothetical protein [unclassified Pseudoalteromonas]
MSEREKNLKLLNDMSEKPGGGQALRVALHSASSLIPGLSGLAAGTISLQAEKEQQAFNDTIVGWSNLADDELSSISSKLRELTKEPSEASLALLLGQILGDQLSISLFQNEGASVPVILNANTVAELEPYIERNFIKIEPTGSICSMGAGNRVGNHIEELKRPYGQGSGFIVSVIKK